MPGPVDTDALLSALSALTGRAGPPPNGGGPPAAILAFQVLGAAEGQAMRAQEAEAAPGETEGASGDDILVAEAFGAAGCESEQDALAVLRWRAEHLSRALEYVDLGGPYGVRDRMMGIIGATAAALARMVAAAYVMRDPESKAADQRLAAEDWWAATDSLRRAFGTGEVQLAPEPGHADEAGHVHGPQGCPDCR